MTGNNRLQLCPAEMVRAVEYYLCNVLFKEPVKVASVKEDNNTAGVGFTVYLEEIKRDDRSVSTAAP